MLHKRPLCAPGSLAICPAATACLGNPSSTPPHAAWPASCNGGTTPSGGSCTGACETGYSGNVVALCNAGTWGLPFGSNSCAADRELLRARRAAVQQACCGCSRRASTTHSTTLPCLPAWPQPARVCLASQSPMPPGLQAVRVLPAARPARQVAMLAGLARRRCPAAPAAGAPPSLVLRAVRGWEAAGCVPACKLHPGLQPAMLIGACVLAPCVLLQSTAPSASRLMRRSTSARPSTTTLMPTFCTPGPTLRPRCLALSSSASRRPSATQVRRMLGSA